MRRNDHVDVSPFAIAARAGVSETAAYANGHAARAPFESFATGLDELDCMLGGGLHPGELTVVAALTGKGKSSFVDQLALTISRKIATTYLSLEMGYDRTMERLVSKLTGIPAIVVRGLLAQPELDERIACALDKITFERNLRISEHEDDVPATLEAAFTQIRADGSRLVIFDSLDQLEDWSDPPNGMRADYVARNVLRRVVAMAKQHRIHVVSAHQLKAPVGRGRKPDVGDIADSYHVAKIADTVLMLHRPHFDDRARDNVAEILIRKNRSGPTCTLHVEWNGPTMSFRDMLPDDQARLTCCKKK